ncbi:MAG: DMT family transporter [candidate division Zixibacteria bacterium]|nr:DMT family transporter [candidate division Zixibacteria bacterium]
MASQQHQAGNRAFWVLVLGAVCISFAAIFVKAIGNERLGPTAIGFWRMLFGAIALFVWTIAEGRRVGLPRRIYFWSMLAGLAFFCDLYCWHRSIFLTGAGMATILGNTQVFGSAILGYFAFKEKLSAKFFVAAIAGFAGIVLLIGVGSDDVQLTQNYLLGVAFGLATGVFYASYISVVKQASQEHIEFGTLALMAWISLFCAIFLGVTASFEATPMLPPDATTWLLLIGLGLVPQALGWRAISSSLPHIDAHKAGLALLLQPTLATAWGFMLFGEVLSVLQIAGAVITLGAIYFGSVRE